MKSCLIVSGGYEPHRAGECALRIAAMLQPEGFHVALRDDLAAYDEEDLGAYDLIVPNWTVGHIGVETTRRISAAVASGVGLAGFHGGMADGFPGSGRFRYIVGGSYVAEPGGIHSYTVEIRKQDDPIMRGMSSFSYESEQYYMHVDPAVEVLAVTRFDGTVHPWIAGVEMPSIWKKSFGSGRVFFSALGHVPEEFDHQSMREILRRGLLWASR